MPVSPVSTLTRAATRKDNEPLNILTFVTHERYEPNLCKTGHNFYVYTGEGIRDWNTKYAPIPENYMILDKSKEGRQIPINVDIDVIISQNLMAHHPIAESISRQLNVPIINIHHVLPPLQWGKGILDSLKIRGGAADVYITHYNEKVWDINIENSTTIYHGIDYDFWNSSGEQRGMYALSVVNDWINRDWCCGYSIWKHGTQDIPTKVIGNTPGLSEPSESLEELRGAYSKCGIFINTSTHSPLPMSLLEAMSCGCPVVSMATCAIPEVVEHGVNGLLANSPEEVNSMSKELFADDELRAKLGSNARKTILEKFSISRFVNEWNKVLKEVLDNV
tara:strand:- start:3862 stop:4866 length:1005 start_codon:yes stop_codon:yes gene_type:complete